jgi:hypothetical protein
MNKREQLRRFLECVTCLSKFCPHLSSTAEHLRHLLKKDIIWSWTSSHDKAYNDIDTSLCSDRVLATFDASKPVTVSVDSSQSGIGTVLTASVDSSQSGIGGVLPPNRRPVEYASSAMTSTQKMKLKRLKE